MLATLAIATALSLAPAQESKLELANAHTTYGVLGNTRENNKYLPGDLLVLTFDIKGLSVGKGGEIKYSMGVEFNDASGKRIYKEQPQSFESLNLLGGNQVPAFALGEVRNNVAPGKYSMTVTVRDDAVKDNKEAKLTHAFEVPKKDFGIVRLGLFYDPRNNEWAPPLFVPGQSVYLGFNTIGFDRNAKTKQPDMEVRMRVLDDSGKPTLPKPLSGDTKIGKVDPTQDFFPWWQKIELNRPGNFKIEVEAEDKVAKKTVREVLNIKVVEVK